MKRHSPGEDFRKGNRYRGVDGTGGKRALNGDHTRTELPCGSPTREYPGPADDGSNNYHPAGLFRDTGNSCIKEPEISSLLVFGQSCSKKGGRPGIVSRTFLLWYGSSVQAGRSVERAGPSLSRAAGT